MRNFILMSMNLFRAVLSMAVLFSFSSGCSDQEPTASTAGARGSWIETIHETSFVDLLDDAKVTESPTDYRKVDTYPVEILGDSREVLFHHPPSTIEFQPIELGEEASLEFAIALNPTAWEEAGDGVTFKILVRSESGAESEIYSRYIDPKHNPNQRRWIDERLDLARFRGQRTQFVFQTDPGPESNTYFDWSIWGNPKVTSTRSMPTGEGRLSQLRKPKNSVAGERPNILLIVVDTLRGSDLSYVGYARMTSPNLDALAEKSVVFENALSIGANTTVGMAGLMTGKLPHFELGEPWTDEYRFGMNRFYTHQGEIGLPSSLPTLAELLAESGYITAGIVTNPYLLSVYQFDQGFEIYEELMADSGYVAGDEVSDAAVEYLSAFAAKKAEYSRHSDRGRAPEKNGDRTAAPFFLYLHYMDVHGPYYPAKGRSDCFSASRGVNISSSMWERWENIEGLPDTNPDALLEPMKEAYDCSIVFVDEQIGRVLSRLRELSLEQNTIVAFTSDHGEEFLEHGGTTHKGSLYRELLHVPMIIHLPNGPPGRIGRRVRNFDILPTLLDLAGVDSSSLSLDAKSLKPFLEGADPPFEATLYTGFPWARTFISGDFRVIQRSKGDVEIFDLISDPAEQNPMHEIRPMTEFDELWKKYRDLVGRLDQGRKEKRISLKKEHERRNANRGPDEATLKQLRSLGYVE